MDSLCELLDTYNGRDKIVRLACYSLKLWGSLTKNEGLLQASGRLSATRATMRLFDDLPMLKYTIEYGLGKQEPDRVSSVLGVLGNAADQLFLPIEKVCWLGECGVLKLTDRQSFCFDTANTVFWASSLYITLVKCLREFQCTLARRELLARSGADPKVACLHEARFWIEAVTCFKLLLDLTHAVNCLPRGWLWGGRLDGVKVGAIATLSSLIGLAAYFAKKNYSK